jgi:hypothetical protein
MLNYVPIIPAIMPAIFRGYAYRKRVFIMRIAAVAARTKDDVTESDVEWLPL